MNNKSLDQLIREAASAKKKMILGIVFTAVADFLAAIGIATMYIYIGIALLIISLPFFGVGIPFLITGIIKTIKGNRAVTVARRNELNAAAQGQPVFAPQQAPSYTQPVTAPQQVPVYTQPVINQQPQVEAPIQPQVQYAAPVQPSAGGFAPLDWQKYNPLDAGVSYNKNKEYKFHRADGFVGSVPQKFVDRTFPKCPICCSKDPHWTIGQHNQMSWKGNLYLFKCSQCESIISMSMPDVTTLGNGGGGVAANPSVGLTNLMVKASSGKEAGAVYAVIESVGNSGVPCDCEGKEFKLEDLQDMYLR